MIYFDVVKGYEDKGINLPERKTAHSAGYDFEVSDDVIIPSYLKMIDEISEGERLYTLDELAKYRPFSFRPTLSKSVFSCGYSFCCPHPCKVTFA